MGNVLKIDTPPARLGKDRIMETVKDAKPEKLLWIVPWALVVDSDRRLWLRCDYPFYHGPGGTVDVSLIKRKNGWQVDIRESDHEWSPDGYSELVALGIELEPIASILS